MSDIEARAAVARLPDERDVYRRIADSSTDWEYLEDADGRILWVSPSCEPLTGHSPDEFLKDPGLLSAVIHPDDRALFASHRRECRQHDDGDAAEFRILRSDGVVRWIGHRCRPMSLPGGASAGRRCSNHDITARKSAERDLLRLNRTLRSLSDCSQAMTRAHDESSFLGEVCRIVVEDCGHAMVWVGYAEEDENKTVRPVAHAGFDQGYIDVLNVTWADDERGRGPTGTAIRTGRPAACRNILTDPRFAPWREEAQKRGYASSVVVPLMKGGKAFGAVNIYSKEPDSFSEEETKLLFELAAYLSNGIEAIRLHAANAEAEKSVQRSEARYRTLFESIDEGFAVCEMIWDEEGKPSDFRYLSVNPAFARLTGLPLERVPGRTVKELIPGLEPFWIETYGRVVKSGRSERFHSAVVPLGKHYEVFAWSTGLDRFAVLFTDVTERRQREAKIEWLASFPARNPYCVVEADEDGRVHYANPTATALFPDLDDPQAPHPWLADWEKAVRRLREPGAGTFSREVTEGERVFEQTLFRLREANRIRVYGKEITEARRGEELQRLQVAALQSAANGIVITGTDGTIQWVNRAFTRLTGYSATEAIGMTSRLLKSGQHTGAFYENLWETILAGRVWRGEIVNRRKDGSLYSEEMIITPVTGAGGSITHFVAIKQDVTARKRAEARLKELNETLEQRVAERTREAEDRSVQMKMLAAELSHTERRERQKLGVILHDHLQQILVAAKFNLDALKGRIADGDLQSLFQRVDEQLDESIAECRSLTVALSPTVLQEAGLATALSWLARRMDEKHRLEVHLDVGGDWVEPADEDVKTLLFDAVRELLFNVVKHSGVLEARIALGHTGRHAEVRVEDRGKGMDRKVPLDHWDETTGVGLFFIQKRLDLIGGGITVENAPGLGVRVTVRAPMRPVPVKPASGEVARVTVAPQGTPARDAQAVAAATASSRRIRVLLADDHRMIRQALIALLKAEGNIDVVGEAADGAEAVELARTLDPDVIIMDVSMPNLNGIDATRHILAERPAMRIIGLSMHEDEAIAASMREAGAVDFVTKGGRPEALIAAIRAALRPKAVGEG